MLGRLPLLRRLRLALDYGLGSGGFSGDMSQYSLDNDRPTATPSDDEDDEEGQMEGMVEMAARGVHGGVAVELGAGRAGGEAARWLQIAAAASAASGAGASTGAAAQHAPAAGPVAAAAGGGGLEEGLVAALAEAAASSRAPLMPLSALVPRPRDPGRQDDWQAALRGLTQVTPPCFENAPLSGTTLLLPACAAALAASCRQP